MKNIKAGITVLTFLTIMMAATAAFAQVPSQVERKVKDFVQKYDGTEGVECVVATKGNGLELIKIMFNKQFGKNFMKGVTSITVIDYTSASKETCITLRKDLDSFLSILQEFDMNDEKEFADYQYVRSFASESDSNTISDFVIAFEDDSSKMLMYMAGKIVVE